jgi:CheY-like chemotaxis protein
MPSGRLMASSTRSPGHGRHSGPAHPSCRGWSARILAGNLPDATVEEAVEGREALERLRTGACLTLPEFSGLEVLSELKNLHPELPVLIFSMHTDEPNVRESPAMRTCYGATSSWSTARKTLLMAIRTSTSWPPTDRLARCEGCKSPGSSVRPGTAPYEAGRNGVRRSG